MWTSTQKLPDSLGTWYITPIWVNTLHSYQTSYHVMVAQVCRTSCQSPTGLCPSTVQSPSSDLRSPTLSWLKRGCIGIPSQHLLHVICPFGPYLQEYPIPSTHGNLYFDLVAEQRLPRLSQIHSRAEMHSHFHPVMNLLTSWLERTGLTDFPQAHRASCYLP